MQSGKKSFISPTPRTVTYTYSSNKNVPKRRNAFIQTDRSVPPFEELLEVNKILRDEFTFDDQTKKAYTMALDYINSVHSRMNKNLYEKYGECGDTEPEANNFFKLPKISNYSTVYQMLLEKTRPPSEISEEAYNALMRKENNKSDFDVISITQSNVIELLPDIKKLTEYKIVEQNAVFNEDIREIKRNSITTRNICDITLPVQFETMEDTDDDLVMSQEPAEFHATHTEENINYVKQVVIYSKKNSVSDGDRIIVESGCENETYSCGSEKECGPYLDGIKHENEETQVIYEGPPTKNKEKHVSSKVHQQSEGGSHSGTNGADNHDSLDKKAIMDVIKQRVQEEFLTYLNTTNLKNMHTDKKARLAKSNFHGVNIQPQINLFEYAQKKLESRRNNFERETKSAESERPHKQNLDDILLGRKSIIIKPSTPEKVTNLFRKISQENFRGDDVKYWQRNQSVDTPSDNDSVILDDEEFEKMSKGHFKAETKAEEVKTKKNIPDQTYEKSHPLKLNGKDMTKLNEKVLSAIGLFTERGDIRPGIIDILEEEKRNKAKDSRNKPFRGKRQWDLQFHLKPKGDINSVTSVSTEKSFISMSSDIKSDFETIKKISNQMGNFKK